MCYKIIQDSNDIQTKIIYFEDIYIGDIYTDDGGGFTVCPAWDTYSGFFHNFDTACVELIFQYFHQVKQKNFTMC